MHIKKFILILLACAVALPTLAVALDPQQSYLPYYWVKGTVTKDGAAVASQAVSFYHKDFPDKKLTAETDKNGYYEISVYDLNYYHNVAVDFGVANYVLEVAAADNWSAKESVALTVDAGFTTKDLVLVKESKPEPKPSVSSVVITPPSVTLAPLAQQTFSAKAYDASGKEIPDQTFAWSVENDAAGTIDQKSGLFTAKTNQADYNNVIKAVAGNVPGYASITISNATPVLKSVKIDPSSITLQPKATQPFTAIGYDQNKNEMSGITFSWEVLKTAAGSIDNDGKFISSDALDSYTDAVKVTGKDKAGNTAEDYASVTISTTPSQLTTIKVDPEKITLAPKGIQIFSANGLDQNGNEIPNTTVTWSLANNAAGSIGDKSGVFTAGETEGPYVDAIVASSGTVKGSASVTISKETPVLTSIIVSPDSVKLSSSDTKLFSAKGLDQNKNELPDTVVSWSVVNADAGTINSTSGFFTASDKAGVYSKVINAVSGNITGFAAVEITEKPKPITTGSVSGTVLGADGKALPANTATTLWVDGTPYAATTDDTGKITVADLPPGKDYIITVGYDSATGSKYGVDIVSGETTLAGNIPTYAGGTLTGTLKDPEGNLLANKDNITIVVDGILKEGVKTNSAGQFAVDGINEGKDKLITISADNLSATTGITELSAGKIFGLAPVTLYQTPPKKGSVTGEVVGADNNTPISGAMVYITSINNPNLLYFQKTGPAGTFYILDAMEGTYTLVIVPPGTYLTLTKPNIIVEDNKTTSLGKLTLTPMGNNKGAIFGMVQNKANQAALDKAKVALSKGDQLISSVSTGSDGLFSFENLDPGTYSLKASIINFKESPQNATVDAGKTTLIGFNLISSETGSIAGIIKGINGETLNNTTLSVWIGGTSYVATTDASGNLTVVDLPPGKDYIVTIGYDSATGSKYGVNVTSGETTALGEIKTYSGGTLTGTLKDPEGNLLAGKDNITIVVDGMLKEGVKTSSQGQFAVDGIGADKNKMVTISTDTLSTTISPYVSDYAAGKIYSLGVVTLNLAPPKKGNVTGEVVAADTGAPLAGVSAYLSNNANLVYIQKTGSDGIFHILDATEGTYTLIIMTQDNYLSLTKPDVVVAANQTTAVGKLALTPLEKGKGAILGLVQNQEKQALSGVKIDLLAGDKLINTIPSTGSEGLFPFENLEPGIYSVKAGKSGYKEETQVITVEAGKTTATSLTLTASALKVTTTSLPDGQVSAAYLATLEAANGTLPYTWEVESGALPKGLDLNKAAGKIDGAPTAATTETFTIKVKDAANLSAAQSFKITIIPAPGTGSITGIVIDANGKPVEGATVSLGTAITTTDAEGKYTFANVPAGSYMLYVSANGYESASLSVSVVAGETSPADTIKLIPLSKDKAEIHGYVKDAAGQPLDGACVSAGKASTFTGSCGWYQLTVDPGAYTVSATLDGFVPAEKAATVAKGESKLMEDFKLTSKDSAKTGTILGTITDMKTKKGVSGATVSDGTRSVATDLDGNYSISDVPEGSYTIKVDATGYVTGKKEEVPVTPGQTTTANIALSLVPSNKAVVHGYVRDDSSKKLDLVKVEAKGTIAYSLDGWYSLTIDPGTYTLKASLSGYKEATHEVTIAAGESKQADLMLEKITAVEAKPSIRVWFSQRLYQKAMVEKGNKFVTSSKPEINIEVSINDPYTLPNDVSGYSITLDPDTPNSKTYNLSAQNITKKVYAAGYQPAAFKSMAVSSEETKEAEKIQSYSLQYTITDEISEGPHIFSFTARSSGLAGIAAVQTESASIEVMGGPLRMVGVPLTYPSPFSISKQNTVTVQYNLSANAKIDIYITGVSGMRIKKFSIDAGSEGGTAGLNKVTWDGRTDQGFLAGNAIYVGTIINRDDGKLLGKFKLTIVD